jgi:hypothetical protein
MNRIFHTIWNEVTKSYVAASEAAKSRGKRTTKASSAAVAKLAVRPMAMEQRFMFDAAAITSANFDFEAGLNTSGTTSGHGVTTATQTISGETLNATVTAYNSGISKLFIDTESNYAGGDLPLVTGNALWNDYFQLDSTVGAQKTSFSLNSGKLFTLTFMTIAEFVGNGYTPIITTSKGSVVLTLLNSDSATFDVSTLNSTQQAYFQDITSFDITASEGEYYFVYDNISLVNIHDPAASGPTTTVTINHLSDDTGSSGTDWITKTATQTISGTLSANLGAGEKVEVSYDNGSTWSDATSYTAGQNSWSTNTTLSGSNTFKARVSDGTNSGSAASQAYELDTTAPTITFSGLALSADTGASSSDFITQTAAQTITATLSSAPAGTDIVYGSLDNGVTWTNITNKVSGTTLSWNGVTLTGSDTLKLKVTDAAGNDGAVSGQAYVLDTTSPTVTVASAAFSADTGTSSTDFITKTAAQTISGTLSANLSSGETVYVSLDNGSTWAAATATVGQNTWSLSGQTLTASNTLKVRVTDTAGNNGTALSQAYVLDTTAPATTVSTASFSADTGTSSTDFITKTAAQTISGTLSANVAAGEVV